MPEWYVYMVRCQDRTLYTGITTDLQRREKEHNESPRAAKYVRSRRPVKLVYQERVPDRSTASRREHEIKQLPRPCKEELLRR